MSLYMLFNFFTININKGEFTMSSFKEILEGILNNTEVTIDKNGIGIKNGNFNMNIPTNSTSSVQIGNTSKPEILVNDNNYTFQGVCISGAHDLFGGITLTALFTKNDIVTINPESLLRELPKLDTSVTVDPNDNRIRVLKDDALVIMVAEVHCYVYNNETYYSEKKSAINIISQQWAASISKTVKLLLSSVPNADECINSVGNCLLTINSDDRLLCCAQNRNFLSVLKILGDYFSETGRSYIGDNIAEYEKLTYIPEVPSGVNLGFMKKYQHFFDDRENMVRYVKLGMLSEALPKEVEF